MECGEVSKWRFRGGWGGMKFYRVKSEDYPEYVFWAQDRESAEALRKILRDYTQARWEIEEVMLR